MGLTAKVQLGRPPHPSIALVDRQWWTRELGNNATSYVRLKLKADNKYLGVLRVLDSGARSEDDVFLDPKAWLSEVPPADSEVELEAVDIGKYTEWRKEHTTAPRMRFWAALFFTVAAGLIQLSWDIGKYWVLWHPGNFWAGLSQLCKWILLTVGVAGIAWYKEYRSIE
jgi:hypothetical protein